MAHDKEGHIGRRELVLDKGGHVGDDLDSGAGQTSFRGLGDAAAPAALVPAKDLDALGSKRGEEVIVTVDVLAIPVDKDEFGLDGTGGLGVCVSEVRWMGIGGAICGRSYCPCFGVELDTVNLKLALTVDGHGDGSSV